MNIAPANLDSPPPVAPAQSPRGTPAWGKWGLRITAISYLFLMIVLPLSAIFENGLKGGLGAFLSNITAPVAFSALKLTLIVSIIVTALNAVMGTLTAYVLVRYRFYGRGLLN